MRLFTRDTAERKLEKKDFFLVFNKSFERSMTVENARGGFRGTGLFPFNPQAIPEEAFAPSRTPERPLPIGSLPDVDATTPLCGDPHQIATTTISSLPSNTADGTATDVQNRKQNEILSTSLPCVSATDTGDPAYAPAPNNTVPAISNATASQSPVPVVFPSTFKQTGEGENETARGMVQTAIAGVLPGLKATPNPVAFKDLMPLPQRERPTSSRPPEKKTS